MSAHIVNMVCHHCANDTGDTLGRERDDLQCLCVRDKENAVMLQKFHDTPSHFALILDDPKARNPWANRYRVSKMEKQQQKGPLSPAAVL